jgi:ParB/Sulfiredoxin domain
VKQSRKRLKAKPKAAERRPWPANKIEQWPLGRIKPYAKNPRTHNEAQVAQIVASMKRYGVTAPVLVDEKGVLIYGHGRLLAAQQLELPKFPVVVARGWSEEDKKAYRIADNQIALNAEWDYPSLQVELTELSMLGYDMPLLGFNDLELVQFLAGVGGEPAAEPGQGIGSLAERFGVVPFSVLNAREGWWQDRKRAWLALGIQSELGRGENLLKFSDTLLEPDPAKRAAKQNAKEAQAQS